MIAHHFHLRDLVLGIEIAIPCIVAIYGIVWGLIRLRDKLGSAADPMQDITSELPHSYPRERRD